MRIVPSIPLLTISTTIRRLVLTAVASSWPLIEKSPSPDDADHDALRVSNLAAIAAGTP